MSNKKVLAIIGDAAQSSTLKHVCFFEHMLLFTEFDFSLFNQFVSEWASFNSIFREKYGLVKIKPFTRLKRDINDDDALVCHSKNNLDIIQKSFKAMRNSRNIDNIEEVVSAIYNMEDFIDTDIHDYFDSSLEELKFLYKNCDLAIIYEECGEIKTRIVIPYLREENYPDYF